MQAADSEANIIFGANIDESLEDEVRITVIATGFEKTPFPTREPKGKRPGARPVTGVYGTASAAVNPYEHRAAAEPITEDAPAPLNTYDADSFAPGATRPQAQQRVNAFVPPYAAMPQQQAAAPQYSAPAAYQPPVAQVAPVTTAPAASEPVGSEKDDLGVPAFLRRKR